jgi:hypothetical protein
MAPFSLATRNLVRLPLLLVASGILLWGLRAQVRAVQPSEFNRDDLATASVLMQDLGEYVQANRSGQAMVAIDGHLDYTPPLVARLYYYEQHRVWLDLVGDLGVGAIQTVMPEAEVLRQAAASDVLVLTRGGSWFYPYDLSIERAKPALFALADQQFALLRQYHIYDRDVFVYVRPVRAS